MLKKEADEEENRRNDKVNKKKQISRSTAD